MNLIKEIGNAFNRQAANYEQAAKVQQEIGERLFERLDYLKIEPKTILDLGCGTGFFMAKLKKKYPSARIIGLDLAFLMLQQAKKKYKIWQKSRLVNGDMLALPFADGVIDLVFANQAIHWALAPASVFNELSRVMKQDGCLMFSSLGPDTFKEIKTAWQPIDNHAHINEFIDMHDIGDCLMANRLIDPVVDMELLTVHYPALSNLVKSLQEQGVKNINPLRNKGLTGKKAWQLFEYNFKKCLTTDGKYPLTYEIIYGHAWKGIEQQTGGQQEAFIPVAQIRRHSP